MFCPNCSQAFNARGAHRCPNCKFDISGGRVPFKKQTTRNLSQGDAIMRALDHPLVDAGIKQGLKLLFIAVGFFPVYLVISSLYPANDNLVKGQRSSDLFNTAGKAVLLTLAVAGVMRIAYALIFDRRAAIREGQSS